MKKLIYASLLFLTVFAVQHAKAQLNVNVNIGSQPLWGPVGYDHAEYYYLPDIESYYYVPKRQFIYLNGGTWAFTTALPASYRSYNLYNGYKVVINSPKPYLNFKNDKVKYAKFKGNKGQTVILKSNDPKYYVVKGHPKHVTKVTKVKVNKGKAYAVGQGNGKAKGKGKH